MDGEMRSPRATLRESPPLFVVDLEGEVTAGAEGPLTAVYEQASARGARRLLLNFAAVDYVNSAGIAAVIGLLTATRRDGVEVQVMGLNAHYRKIFEMMGLTQFAPLVESEGAARQTAGG
jgi:anti-anti-sigma factor